MLGRLRGLMFLVTNGAFCCLDQLFSNFPVFNFEKRGNQSQALLSEAGLNIFFCNRTFQSTIP